jgi:hypothetical protein
MSPVTGLPFTVIATAAMNLPPQERPKRPGFCPFRQQADRYRGDFRFFDGLEQVRL